MDELMFSDVYKKHNNDVLPNVCTPLNALITKLQDSSDAPGSSLETFIVNIAKNLGSFMMTYKLYQLSYVTQNMLVGEFFMLIIDKLPEEKRKTFQEPRHNEKLFEMIIGHTSGYELC
ncbi:hypothetical protein JTE90_005664 [Oedothorax gibbosus]|uniref:Uncharacterized protein n=1 Tax=Oedothorax gibbosus TaxID=931172 RepID=A0AAV6UI44_9ARAC|nr:hypothetical protein JTE90_005664 [Oedothorax gibbosus]